MKKPDASQGQPPSQLISRRIAELGDWRGETLGIMRKLIKEADPDVVEEWKWMGTPAWSHGGIICTGESCLDAFIAGFHQLARRSAPVVAGNGVPQDLRDGFGDSVALAGSPGQAIAEVGLTRPGQCRRLAADAQGWAGVRRFNEV